MTTTPRMIAVDFDGTICNFAFPDIGSPKEGVKDALTKFQELGYKVIIFTCRTSQWFPEIFGEGDASPMERGRVKEMQAYLKKHGIPYDMVDDGSKGKPMCDFYIDDKGVRFSDNWAEITKFVTKETR